MIVPREETNVVPNAGALDLTPRQTDAPSAGDVISAAWRQDNLLGSVFSQHRAGNARDPNHNPWSEIEGTHYEPFFDRFATSFNAGQTAALKQQIDMEMADRRTLEAAGGWSILASMGVGLFSPENLLPGGALYRGARTGQAALRTALSTAGATALSSSMGELGLINSQELRTPEESLVNIGVSTLLGGALGGAVSGLVSRADFARLSKIYEAEADAATDRSVLAANEAALLADIPGFASAGADAARPIPSLSDNSIAGKAAATVGKSVAFMNPVLRMLHSPSPVLREVAIRTFESPVYLKRTMEGETSGPAVESLVKEVNQGMMARAVEQNNAAYADLRKSGQQMDRAQFNSAVGIAMRRGDKASNPLVARAAQAWRTTVFEPLKEAAIKAGLLPEDVSVSTAASYFSRVYSRQRIIARENEFKGIVRRHIMQQVRNAEIQLEVSKVDPRYDPPSRPAPDFLSDADRQAYVDEIVENVFDTITGRVADDVDIPLNIVPMERGPLAGRTFNIPDEEILDFLEHDVELVARRYARIMSADIELTNMFGRADLRDQIEAIKLNYRDLRQAVSSNIDPATKKPLAKPLTDQQIENGLDDLTKRERADIRDLRAVRDLIRGVYKIEQNVTGFARAARVGNQINYMRALGGQTLSSLTELGQLIMRSPMSFLADGLVPLARNMQGFKMTVAEAKMAGVVTERILQTRMATLAEINDPYAVRSPFEAFVDNSAHLFSKVTLIQHWTDATKAIASAMTQSRVLRGTSNYAGISKRERAYLAYLGVDETMAQRIARQFEAHGAVEDGGVRVANTEDWDDAWARRVYRAAINKDSDVTVVVKGVGDLPLFANTPLGRMLFQFKTFSLAANQRILMRGLQEGPAGMVAGLTFATMMGILVYYLKAAESNRLDQVTTNPGTLIAEGLDRSGFLSIAFEINNTIEKSTGIGAYGALAAAFPGFDQGGPSSRYITRSLMASWTGPTGDLIDTAIRGFRAVKNQMVSSAGNEVLNALVGEGKDFTEGDIRAIRRLLPGATLPGIRSLVEYIGIPATERAMGVGR